MKLAVLPVLLAALSPLAGATTMSEPMNLKCEYLETPLGLDVQSPRFSWQLQDDRRGAAQSAYRVRVASRPELLEQDKADLWDSGKVESDQSAHVAYAGPPLASARRYFWDVTVWDQAGNLAPASRPTWWETGLSRPEDWKAKWIGYPYDELEATVSTEGMKWIWYPEGDPATSAPEGNRYFRTSFKVPDGKRIDSAVLYGVVDDIFKVHLNGAPAAGGGGWQGLHEVPVAEHLKPGENILAVEVNNASPGPAGLSLLLKITYDDASIQKVFTGDDWRVAQQETEGWTTSTATSAEWKSAKVLGELGMDPWGVPHIATAGGPAALLRKEFELARPVASARVYVTALGSYRLFVNGERIGKDLLTPDWTDYQKRVSYQTYDVTEAVKKGTNVIGAILGDGWYASGLGWKLQRWAFGPPPLRLIAQTHIQYEDGTSETIVTDDSWKWSQSPILRSELYAGETYDARLEQAGWSSPGFDDKSWKSVEVAPPAGEVRLWSQRSPTIQATEELRPVSVNEVAPGVFIYDMGQNMVGWVRLKAKGPEGTKVRMRFAEILKPDGHIYRDNLRRAEATDTYVLGGKGGEEIFEPHFTYHGFRYVELTGYPGRPDRDALTGVVVHTNAPRSGRFESDNPLANKIWLNTLWGQRGNFYSVPTDCPQRDERLGWMGDAQAFWRTACYNMDLGAFTTKWMEDVVEAQSEEGGFSDVSPRIVDMADGAPAWGDAGVIVPYTAWKQYGDRELLRSHWDAMAAWIKYIHDANPDLLWKNRRNNDFGDWVPADSETPKDLIATAYWAYDCRLMAEMAEALGKPEEARRYRELYDGIRTAFTKEFIKPDGVIGNGSQTSYVLAFYMGLVPDEMKEKAFKHLVDDIMVARKGHLSTGFLGTTYLMPVLSENGRNDIAVRLLLNEGYPSWGYMVGKGATTIWERWNGDTGDPAMNSYNHFCYGAVSEWLYRYLAGIDTDPETPGFKKALIRPRIDERFSRVRGEYDSLYGTITTEWRRRPDGAVELDVKIPANTSAFVYVPAGDPAGVTEGGKPAGEAGVKFVRMEDGCAVFEAPAGQYSFTSAR